MKKSLLAVVAALAIAGCSQSEMDEIDSSKTTKQAIDFSTYVGKASRAADNYATADLQKAGMTVYSYMTEGDYSGTGTLTPYMAAASYTFTAPNWSTTKDYYWPTSGKLQFFAIPTGSGITYTEPTNSYPSIEAPMGSDIVAAHKANAASADGSVALNFKHLLTKVSFKCILGNADYQANITNIAIKGILGTGNGTYDFGTAKWSLTGVTEKQYSDYTQDAALLVYPQTTQVTVEVTYSVISKVGNIEVAASATKTASITTDGTWASNKKINYSLTLPINANKIDVSASVDENWETVNSSTTEK